MEIIMARGLKAEKPRELADRGFRLNWATSCAGARATGKSPEPARFSSQRQPVGDWARFLAAELKLRPIEPILKRKIELR
jgi:hypothetical protein